jgi:hypothetical protein
MLEEFDNLPDPDVLAQEIVVPRLASLGTTPSQGTGPGRGPRRGVEDLEALEQFHEIAADLGADLLTDQNDRIGFILNASDSNGCTQSLYARIQVKTYLYSSIL